MRAGLVLVASLTAMVAVPTAEAATLSQANGKARKAAVAYTQKYYGTQWREFDWSARCRRSSSAWKCSLKTDNGQCSGSLKLSKNLSKTYAVRIGCGE